MMRRVEKVLKNGTVKTYLDKHLHSFDDKPSIHQADGTMTWHRYGQMHRDNGPCFVHIDGRKLWRKNGVYHRLDGPALICTFNNIPRLQYLYYIDGEEYYFDEWLEKSSLSDEIKVMSKLAGYVVDKNGNKCKNCT